MIPGVGTLLMGGDSTIIAEDLKRQVQDSLSSEYHKKICPVQVLPCLIISKRNDIFMTYLSLSRHQGK